ncbi:hypothetical protein Ae201684P_005100 [Aphanomyces euteiches]|uniref:Uncharacterized protein n=1 Tax=Aphanomyces euteiches TaxID=100861 RepID=A0A6G0X1I2_9STRA|nr:hypothetical protein Ae201684_009568 [Aphanomyces euteiches]KAH9085392.1 hypothetical protein Ae201684P_005100 [Aphanomyces euteiches]
MLPLAPTLAAPVVKAILPLVAPSTVFKIIFPPDPGFVPDPESNWTLPPAPVLPAPPTKLTVPPTEPTPPTRNEEPPVVALLAPAVAMIVPPTPVWEFPIAIVIFPADPLEVAAPVEREIMPELPPVEEAEPIDNEPEAPADDAPLVIDTAPPATPDPLLMFTAPPAPVVAEPTDKMIEPLEVAVPFPVLS